ncbi:MAG: alpha/beta hydrolase fold domain-containing protein [Clostridia bacterium]|nr:alpha/beta hydrolase fold domain-containing protein [Clostridia bacterium]
MVRLAKITALLLCVALTLGISGCGNDGGNSAVGERGNTNEIASADGPAEEKERYLDVVFDKVDVEQDIVYSETKDYKGEKVKLLLDVYKPQGDNVSNRPALIWVHGGGFIGGSRNQQPAAGLAYEFARRGYVAVSIDYRLRPEPSQDWIGTINDANYDALAAINWLKKNSDKYGVDKDKITIGGDSAGGNIAINVALGGDAYKKDVMALIDAYGPQTLTSLKNKYTPVLLIHGDKDILVPFEDSVNLNKTLDNFGVYHEFLKMIGEGHNLNGIYWEDVVLNSVRFVYNVLKSNISPIFKAEKDNIRATPGESLKIEMKRQDGYSTLEGLTEASLPKGWQWIGDKTIPSGKETIEFELKIPSSAKVGNYFVKFNQTFESGKRKSSVILPVKVVQPVVVDMKPGLASDNTIETTFNVKNNSELQMKSGVIKISNAEEKELGIFKFDDIAPNEIKSFLVKNKLHGDIKVGIDLKDGFKENLTIEARYLDIPFTESKPVLDGKLDEWQKQPSFTVNQAKQVIGISNWGGAEDLSANSYLKWDKENLYIASIVRDNTHFSENLEAEIWNDDSIQLAIDTKEASESYNSDYSELGFTLGSNKPNVSVWRWVAPVGQSIGASADIKCAISRSGLDTVYEIEIPWDSLHESRQSVSSGKLFKFSMLVNDNDGKGRRGWIEYGSGIGSSKDTKLFVDALLVK